MAIIPSKPSNSDMPPQPIAHIDPTSDSSIPTSGKPKTESRKRASLTIAIVVAGLFVCVLGSICLIGSIVLLQPVMQNSLSDVTASNGSVTPRPGHWEGLSPTASFDVTSDGEIRNFKLVAYTLANDLCTIRVEEFSVQPSGGILLTSLIPESSYWPGSERAEFKAKNLWPTPVATANGPMVEAQRVNGRFETPTRLSGTYKILACGGQQAMPNPGKGTFDWKAEWKGPAQ